MKQYLIQVICGVLLCGASIPAQAEGWFLGGGIISASFEDDLSDVDRGSGITFSGGYRFDDLLSAEILSGASYHDVDDSDDELLQFNIMAGAKFSFGGEKFRPYGVVGLSWNIIEYGDLDEVEDDDDYDDLDEIDGFGVYFGFGADIFVARQHAINVGFRSNRWKGKGNGWDLDVQSDIFSLAYNYYFAG
jgi:hypothetical protein